METNVLASRKRNMIFLLAAFSLHLSIGQIHAQSNSNQDKLLKRTLVFTFKATTADSIKAVNNACLELSKISVVKSYEWGAVKSNDEAKPLKHIYVFGYTSEKDIEAYEKSPQHDKVVKVAKPVLEAVQAFDYWVRQ